MELEELADFALKMCMENEQGKVNPNVLYTKTKVNSLIINELEDILYSYGKFTGKGFSDYKWESFIINENGRKLVRTGGFDALRKREKKARIWSKTDRWIDRIFKLFRIFK